MKRSHRSLQEIYDDIIEPRPHRSLQELYDDIVEQIGKSGKATIKITDGDGLHELLASMANGIVSAKELNRIRIERNNQVQLTPLN